MAERDDQMARDARDAQRGRTNEGEDREGLDKALERRNEDLAGDIETNRNLSGSTTYETLHEQGDLDVASGRGENADRGRSAGDRSGDRSVDRSSDRSR